MKSSKTYRAKISPQGQITLPTELRKAMGKKKGDYIVLTYSDSRLSVGAKSSIEKYFGSVNVYGGKPAEKVHAEFKNTFKP